MCKQRIPLWKILIVRAEKPDNDNRNHFDVKFSPGLSYLQLGGGSRAISASSRWILYEKTYTTSICKYLCVLADKRRIVECSTNIFNGPMVVPQDLATGNRNYIAHPPHIWRCKELKMYFTQALITFLFVEQVKQDNFENDEFKDKPYDKWHTRTAPIRNSPSLTFQNRFHYKIILSLASIHTQKWYLIFNPRRFSHLFAAPLVFAGLLGAILISLRIWVARVLSLWSSFTGPGALSVPWSDIFSKNDLERKT